MFGHRGIDLGVNDGSVLAGLDRKKVVGHEGHPTVSDGARQRIRHIAKQGWILGNGAPLKRSMKERVLKRKREVIQAEIVSLVLTNYASRWERTIFWLENWALLTKEYFVRASKNQNSERGILVFASMWQQQKEVSHFLKHWVGNQMHQWCEKAFCGKGMHIAHHLSLKMLSFGQMLFAYLVSTGMQEVWLPFWCSGFSCEWC